MCARRCYGSLNYALLIAKFSIYCSCLHKEKIPFDSFLILLCEELSIQKEIAFGNIIDRFG